ncbi:dynein regulatory complex protein 11-like [Adelges cooleyi]|uniref:dynein regulatory complex protein 11-like n=1 Tax=Adelges cooleyi TaxID=133065 RepID=UPI00217F9542|nr:dynein regulatory complex protein 11-like [Adelges cooleyi]
MVVYGSDGWKSAVEKLINLKRDDQEFVAVGLYVDRNVARSALTDLYVRYSLVANELTAHHDSIIQPQVRTLIKKLLLPTFGRLVELKQTLIDEDKSIYTPVDETLAKLRVPYDRFELRIPRCFLDDRRTLLEGLDDKVDEIYKRMEKENASELIGEMEENAREAEETWSEPLIRHHSSGSDFDVTTFKSIEEVPPVRFRKITEEDLARDRGVLLIQKHIRASRDRIYANELLALQRSRQRILSGEYVPPKREIALSAAIKVQRFWRNYQMKKRMKIKNNQKKLLIGWHMASKKPPTSTGAQEEDTRMVKEDTLWTMQTKAADKFWTAVKAAQARLDKYNKEDIIDEIADELRAYIWNYFETCVHLPSWPDPTPVMFTNDAILGLPPIVLTDTILRQLNIPKMHYRSALNQRVPLGGSAVFLTGRWMTVEMAKILAVIIVELEEKPAREKAKLLKEQAKRQKIEKDQIIAEQKNAEKARQETRSLGFVPEPSEFMEWFKEALDEYSGNWSMFDGEPDGGHRQDLITDNVYADAKVRLRAEVDETVVKELENLKVLFAKDRGKKYKTPKVKAKKAAKVRTKKSKYPEPEEIFEELVRSNMIQKSVAANFEDFKGETSYSASRLRIEPYFKDPPYCVGDVPQMLKELCVFGLTCPELRNMKSVKFASTLMVAGPDKSGKTMLTDAICWTTGSLKIQLNYMNVSDNYPSKKDILAKEYQPVVIVVEMADVPFYKKMSKELKQFNPKLVANLLGKLVKTFVKTDRILVVGNAVSPWLCAGAKLVSAFNQILFTVADYGTTFMHLLGLLMSYPAVSRDFPVTALATLMMGYPLDTIADMVAQVLTTERVLTLKHSPLDAKEFLSVMLNNPKEVPPLADLYHNWYRSNVPLAIRRSLKLTAEAQAHKDKKKKK